ncbi:putative DNA-directed RNA polymerase III RPC4 [Aspergillus lucknowensis]|uniref:RNA polymerase III RPC4-domain-containing protein n=1 Tax=Aspergillus lucknowensis TaxID=176173 RepID=A0ABR4LEE4_9EURO
MPPKVGSRRGASSTVARGNNNTNQGSVSAPNATPSSSSNTPATPAPTPTTSTPGTTTRQPVQRLQSLKKRAPSGSIGPGATPRPTSAVPGAGENSKPTLKYKPRAVGRRSKEEREAIEKLEAERNAERLAEAAAIQHTKANLAARGRASFSGRGRGGSMAMGSMGAAGPLGSGFAGRRGRGGSRFGTVDSRATSISRRSKSTTTGAPGSVSSDESDSEIRVSIDQINLGSDPDNNEEDPVLDHKKKMKQWKGKVPLGSTGEKGLRPIRVERHEHEERVVSVNMESSTSKSAEMRQQAKGKGRDHNALFVQDDDETSTETEPRVKQEPTDENDQAMAEVPHTDEAVTTDDGLLPAPKVNVRRRLRSKEPSVVAVKDPRSLLRTNEDIEEYDRHAEDIEIIKYLFAKEPPTKTKESTEGVDVTTEVQDNEKKEDGEDEMAEDDKLSGQLFLMQFPPITPNLIIPNTGELKRDEEVTEIPNPVASQGANQSGISVKGPPNNLGLKREEDFEVLDGPDDSTATGTFSKVVTAADRQLEAGQAGKLNVHASGRVTMDWGGISFELDRATAVDFLQEALIVSTPPNATEDVVDDEHKVWAMGQLSGKFTVMPDWEKML